MVVRSSEVREGNRTELNSSVPAPVVVTLPRGRGSVTNVSLNQKLSIRRSSELRCGAAASLAHVLERDLGTRAGIQFGEWELFGEFRGVTGTPVKFTAAARPARAHRSEDRFQDHAAVRDERHEEAQHAA
jgi:hypothetical protein